MLCLLLKLQRRLDRYHFLEYLTDTETEWTKRASELNCSEEVGSYVRFPNNENTHFIEYCLSSEVIVIPEGKKEYTCALIVRKQTFWYF